MRNEDEQVESVKNDKVEYVRNEEVETVRFEDEQSVRNEQVESVRNEEVESVRNEELESVRNEEVESVDHPAAWEPGMTCRIGRSAICRQHHYPDITLGWFSHWRGLLDLWLPGEGDGRRG